MIDGVKIFADGAVLSEMLAARDSGGVDGFTTNPTLLRRAGVTDYRSFAREVLAAIPDFPISFEVLADEPGEMGRQAREIASWGEHVYVKIPVTTTGGQSTAALVRALSTEGVRVNVTAVFTEQQVAQMVDQLGEDTPAVISVFAGRIANAGVDPIPIVARAVEIVRARPHCEVLWASPREVLNVKHAAQAGCQIITLTPDLLSALKTLGKDLGVYSRETVQMFFDDAQASGLSL